MVAPKLCAGFKKSCASASTAAPATPPFPTVSLPPTTFPAPPRIPGEDDDIDDDDDDDDDDAPAPVGSSNFRFDSALEGMNLSPTPL